MGLTSLMQGKGLLGMGLAQPPAGLLGPYYNPKQERQQKLLMGLQGAGLALLQNGKGSFGEVLGQAVAGGAQGANNAGINYKQDAMGYNQLDMQMKEQKEKERNKAAVMQWLDTLPDDQQELARVNPQMAAEAYMKQQFAAPDKGTDDMQEYQYGQKDPAFSEWLTGQKKAGATNVTVGGGKYGTIPPGFELVETPQGAQLRPIPGGPAALEAAALAEKNKSAKATEAGSGDIVLTDISRALDKMKKSTLPTTGMMGSLTQDIPGFAAHDVNKLLETISGNIGFDRLQQMRNDSPTGGALGAINKTEMDLLQAVKGNLSQSQSQEQLEYNLKRLNNIYLDIVHGPNAGPPRLPLELGQGGDPALKKKYGLE